MLSPCRSNLLKICPAFRFQLRSTKAGTPSVIHKLKQEPSIVTSSFDGSHPAHRKPQLIRLLDKTKLQQAASTNSHLGISVCNALMKTGVLGAEASIATINDGNMAMPGGDSSQYRGRWVLTAVLTRAAPGELSPTAGGPEGAGEQDPQTPEDHHSV